MADLTARQSEKLRLLEASLGVGSPEVTEGFEAESSSAYCASLKREEELQFHFMFLYQVIVLALAAAVLILLVLGAWQTAKGEGVNALIAGAGALVSGTAASFLLKQRSDARDAHAAAQEGLERHNCSI